jgi:hypothetical protein
MYQTTDEIRAAVDERIESERRTFAPGPEQAETQKENGSPLAFPSHIMTEAAGYFAGVLSDCMEPHFVYPNSRWKWMSPCPARSRESGSDAGLCPEEIPKDLRHTIPTGKRRISDREINRASLRSGAGNGKKEDK